MCPEAQETAQVIFEYSRVMNILDDFEHQRLVSSRGTKKSKYKQTYEEVRSIIEQMKKKFIETLRLSARKKTKTFMVPSVRFARPSMAKTSIPP
ncbi:MAG TPA: hypothetical protein PKJ10_03815 [Smithella sp.]|nr:hypothetical protein [Smithella sp.]